MVVSSFSISLHCRQRDWNPSCSQWEWVCLSQMRSLLQRLQPPFQAICNAQDCFQAIGPLTEILQILKELMMTTVMTEFQAFFSCWRQRSLLGAFMSPAALKHLSPLFPSTNCRVDGKLYFMVCPMKCHRVVAPLWYAWDDTDVWFGVVF